MKLEDLSRELDMNDPELNGKMAGYNGEVRMSTYAEGDIPADEGHRIVTSTMDDWEQPNQVVCCEVE